MTDIHLAWARHGANPSAEVLEVSDRDGNKFLPAGSCYVPVPIPATRNLVESGQRAAARVLYALCLHLGPGLVPVYPSYETISKYAYVGENGIRKALNVLVHRGYISIKKTREGRKTRNYYTILEKAYTEDVSHRQKSNQVDTSIRICHTCYEEVPASEGLRMEDRSWEGERRVVLRHAPCWPWRGSAELVEDSRGIRIQQEQFWSSHGRLVVDQPNLEGYSQSL